MSDKNVSFPGPLAGEQAVRARGKLGKDAVFDAIERGATAPIRIVGSQRDTNIKLVVEELVRTASNRGCGPPLPRARRHEGALTDDLRSPSSQTLPEERVAALGCTMTVKGSTISTFSSRSGD